MSAGTHKPGPAAPVMFSLFKADGHGAPDFTEPVRFYEKATAPGDLLLAQRCLSRAFCAAQGAEANLGSPSMSGLAIELADVIPVFEVVISSTSEALEMLRAATLALSASEEAAGAQSPGDGT